MTLKAFLILVFGVLPALGFVHLLRMLLLGRHGIRVRAKVVGFEEHETEAELRGNGLSRTRRVRQPIVTFTDTRGTPRTLTLPDERPKADRADPNTLLIVYPKRHPDQARIAHWHARYALVLLWFLPALAVLVFLLGAVLIHYAHRGFGG